MAVSQSIKTVCQEMVNTLCLVAGKSTSPPASVFSGNWLLQVLLITSSQDSKSEYKGGVNHLYVDLTFLLQLCILWVLCKDIAVKF